MKFVSWNVNGLRSSSGIVDAILDFDADFVCLQETKVRPGELYLDFPGYRSFWNYAEKKGYSGTCVYSRHEPVSVRNGFGVARFDCEGRAITLEMPGFYLVNIYSPHSQSDLYRLQYRMDWEDALREYISVLMKDKPVIVCGDFNVVYDDIDFERSPFNRLTPCLTEYERNKMSELLSMGFVDVWRLMHPGEIGGSLFPAGRSCDGWRLDYFLVSKGLQERIVSSDILRNIYGSDHCPIELVLDI